MLLSSRLTIRLGMILLFGSFFVVFTHNTYAATISVPPPLIPGQGLSNGLIGWWTFDGPDMISNVKDKSGNGNSGTLQGSFKTATSSAVVVGKLGQGIKFNGVNDYVKLSSSGFGTLVSQGNFTASYWVKTNLSSTRQIIMGDHNSSGTGSSVTFEFGGFGQNQAHITTSIAGTYLDSNVTYTPNVWYHVVVTRDASNRRIYVNGVEKNSDSNVTLGAGVTLSIGRSGDYSSIYLKGTLDDVRIYNRALSATEIQQLYNIGSATKRSVSTPVNASSCAGQGINCGLVGYWTFDGPDMISNVRDRSGNGNTGYLNGGFKTATSSAIVPAKIGQGLKFNGSSDYVGTNNSSWISQSFSISAWMKSSDTTNTHSILTKLSGTSDWQFFFGTLSTGAIYIKLYGTTATSQQRAWATTATGFNDGKWHHVLVTVGNIDGNIVKTIKFYVDGVVYANTLIESTSSNTAYSVKSSTMSIGARFIPSFSAGMNGSLDDIRLYDRVLSTSEIQQLYNIGSATKRSASPSVNASSCAGQGINCGLVGYWTFDGPDMISNVKDKSGNGNNGTLQGSFKTATSSAVVPGKLGQGIKFNGSDTKIITTSLSSLQSSNAMTISAWLKANTSTGGGVAHLCGSGLNNKIFEFYQRSGTKYNFLIYNAPSGLSVTQSTNNTYSVVNKWMHVVGTYDGANVNLYVNGILDNAAVVSTTTVLGPASQAMEIGKGNCNVSSYFNGSLDDVRIYSRALSATEIQRLYNMGR